MFLILLTFIVSFLIAGIAAWFSISGIMAIFAGAKVASFLMGAVLECGKLLTTSWLYRNWADSPKLIKFPLVGFTIVIMFITSMGTFGFLSKAHIEQGASTGDNVAKIERLDQQITREKLKIADNDKVINQLDAAVNSYATQNKTKQSIDLRRRQDSQRNELKRSEDESQKIIDSLTDQKFILQSSVRAYELEVGPIKYIAALIYSDPTNNLESAVRIVTLIIVSVFDPFAIVLLIAANYSLMKRKADVEKETIKNNKSGKKIIKKGAEKRKDTTEIKIPPSIFQSMAKIQAKILEKLNGKEKEVSRPQNEKEDCAVRQVGNQGKMAACAAALSKVSLATAGVVEDIQNNTTISENEDQDVKKETETVSPDGKIPLVRREFLYDPPDAVLDFAIDKENAETNLVTDSIENPEMGQEIQTDGMVINNGQTETTSTGVTIRLVPTRQEIKHETEDTDRRQELFQIPVEHITEGQQLAALEREIDKDGQDTINEKESRNSAAFKEQEGTTILGRSFRSEDSAISTNVESTQEEEEYFANITEIYRGFVAKPVTEEKTDINIRPIYPKSSGWL